MARERQHEPELYDEWPFAGEFRGSEARFLGVMADGMPMYYHEETGTIYGGALDHESQEIELVDERAIELEAEEAIGSALERLGEETGWESLSEFAEEHLESDG